MFSAKAETKTAQSVIQHPKTEAWFVDALKSAEIMRKGRNCLLGFEGEAQSEDLIGNGIGSSSMAESMVLETSSSFGSTSSSTSLTNLAPVKSSVEEGTTGVQDCKVKFISSDAITRYSDLRVRLTFYLILTFSLSFRDVKGSYVMKGLIYRYLCYQVFMSISQE